MASAPTLLKGMTWSHPRGYEPMLACARAWRARTGVEVTWDKRSLQDFESFPVEELARQYDLIVIDHPHVGQITAEGCLLPLDGPGREAERTALAAGSVGPSYESYRWQGRQWALPIDAATQVQAWRPDLIARPMARWVDVLRLAKAGQVLCPLRSPHALMTFFTLAGNLGHPCATTESSTRPGDLIDAVHGVRVYGMMRELTQHIDPACLEMDPIAAFERMAKPDSGIACVPLAYGYVSYAVKGFRPARILFADIPAAGSQGPIGSTLGGTGIAVSAHSAQAEAAIDFAYWIAGADVQRGLYAASGGQPAHAAAWEDPVVNGPNAGFYIATRPTLEGAWLRPRHNGYMAFQQAAADRILMALKADEDGDQLIRDLNRMFRDSSA